MKKILAFLLMLAFLAPCCCALADTAAHASTQAFLTELDAAGIIYTNYGLDEEGEEHIMIRRNNASLDYQVHFFFEEDQEHASVFVWYIISIDEEDALATMLACNTLNDRYNYTCFYLDESDYTVTASMNLIFRENNVGLVAMDALMYMSDILERACPVLDEYDR